MKKHVFLLTTILLIGIVGCGQSTTGDSTNTATPSADKANRDQAASETEADSQSTGMTINDFANREVTFDEVPQNIVALSNGDMDIIYALGGELVGRPTAHGPISIKEAENVEQIGSTHEIDLEKLTLVQPDVVLGNNPMNTKDIPTIEGIGAKMILTHAHSVDDIKAQIDLFGQLLQKEEKAQELISEIDESLATVQANESEEKPRALLVYGAPGTYMVALPNSLSGNILELAGGDNIAADFPRLENYPQYAQLNTERIVEANPQFVLLMSHGNPEEVKDGFMKEMEQNASWNSLDAVKNNRVEVLPPDLFGTNPGTRVTEALGLLDELLQDVE